ncbi:MAG TPA: hypothetical protein VJG90_05995 [Candidatus Nanoarchaeia archaeon]|nr:hypothetical protein [Candidatus Nanoarchaeia archaeon]
MKCFWLVFLLLSINVLAQSPVEPLIEYPSIYIYPLYWTLPIESNPSPVIQESTPSIEDICAELIEEPSLPAIAF